MDKGTFKGPFIMDEDALKTEVGMALGKLKKGDGSDLGGFMATVFVRSTGGDGSTVMLSVNAVSDNPAEAVFEAFVKAKTTAISITEAVFSAEKDMAEKVRKELEKQAGSPVVPPAEGVN